MITYASVCSGIEAASAAWEPLGWKCLWLAEIDKAARAVLAHHFPDIPNLGDLVTLPERVLAGEIEPPDVLIGGTPCQSFSIAGLRGGMADARGALTLAFVRLADAIDVRRRALGKPPVLIVWENVPGVLTHKENPFGCFLGALAGESVPLIPAGRKWTHAGLVSGPQRTIAWRIFDAQYFGLAQRRNRVFLVASADFGTDPGAILFEREGVRRDSPPCREAGESIAGTVEARPDGGGFPGTDFACAGGVQPVATLDSSYGRLQGASGQDANHGHSHLIVSAFGRNNTSGPIETSGSLSAHGGPHGRLNFEADTFLVQSIPFDTTQSSSPDNYSRPQAGDPCHPLAAGAHPPAICFSSKAHGGDAMLECSPTLRASGHVDSHSNAGAPPAVIFAEAVSPPLRSASDSPAAHGKVNGTDRSAMIAVCVTGSVTHPLKADGFDGSEDGTGRGQPITPVSFTCSEMSNSFAWERDVYPALDAQIPNDTSNIQRGIRVGMRVRRLMPVECERLQGFPDHWTLAAARKGRPAPQADGPRYKQLGNSMPVPVIRWLGVRITAEMPA